MWRHHHHYIDQVLLYKSGITSQDVSKALSQEKAYERFSRFCDGLPLVSYDDDGTSTDALARVADATGILPVMHDGDVNAAIVYAGMHSHATRSLEAACRFYGVNPKFDGNRLAGMARIVGAVYEAELAEEIGRIWAMRHDADGRLLAVTRDAEDDLAVTFSGE